MSDRGKWFYSKDDREYTSHVTIEKANGLEGLLEEFEVKGSQAEYERKALDELDEEGL